MTVAHAAAAMRLRGERIPNLKDARKSTVRANAIESSNDSMLRISTFIANAEYLARRDRLQGTVRS